MDLVEHEAVPGDLLLGAVLRARRVGDERLDALPRRVNILNRVGGLSALDQRDSAERFQAGRVLAAEHLFASARLGDREQGLHASGRQGTEMAVDVPEAIHTKNLLLTPEKYVISVREYEIHHRRPNDIPTSPRYDV